MTYELYCLEECKTVIGKHTVYKLDAYPGPEGDGVFYYIIPIAKDKVLNIIASKTRFASIDDEKMNQPSNYNKIIKEIIQTILVPIRTRTK